MKNKYNMVCDSCGQAWNSDDPQIGAVCPRCGSRETAALNKKKHPAPKGRETRAITEEEYREIIDVMRSGKPGFFAPNERAAMALVMEANLGIRISDIVKLRMCDIIRDGDRWRLSIVEQKTAKERVFTVPEQVRSFLLDYCYKKGIKDNEPIIPVAPRTVQDALKKVTRFLEMDRVGTHSFRKFFATRIYEASGHDTELVREILQHGSLETTQHYLRATSERVDTALSKNIALI